MRSRLVLDTPIGATLMHMGNAVMFLGKNGRCPKVRIQTFAPTIETGFKNHCQMFDTQPAAGTEGKGGGSPCSAAEGSFKLLPNQRVRLYFFKYQLPPSVMQQYFSKGRFVMEVPIDLPPNILSKLGIEAYTIRSGTYPIRETKDFVIIDV